MRARRWRRVLIRQAHKSVWVVVWCAVACVWAEVRRWWRRQGRRAGDARDGVWVSTVRMSVCEEDASERGPDWR